jgi:sodium/potassium-transporting ATPase subunit alpha
MKEKDSSAGRVNPFQQEDGALVVEGYHLNTISSEGWDFIFKYPELVFARTTPEHKLQIVVEAQRRGHIVAVTGDGTNDAPALKRANIGIAMGSGSTVARDAALALLLDDTFTSIPRAVEQGRLLFTNLRNVIAYQISAGCFGELIPVLATFFLGMPTPLNSLMMVMVCITNDTYAGIALMMEGPQTSVMSERPRNPTKNPLVTMKLICYSYFFMTIIQAIGQVYNYFLYMSERGPLNHLPTLLPADDDGSLSFPMGFYPDQLIGAWNWALDGGALGTDMVSAANSGSSVFFTTMVVAQWAHFISIRRKRPYFSDSILNVARSPDNVLVRVGKELLASTPLLPNVVSILLGAAVVNLFNEGSFLQTACATGSVSGRYWGVAFGFGVVVILAGEIRKWVIMLFPQSILARLTEF